MPELRELDGVLVTRSEGIEPVMAVVENGRSLETPPVSFAKRGVGATLLLVTMTLAVTTATAAGPDSTRASRPSTANGATTVIVVRHAEKDTVLAGADVPLRAAGFARAQALARALRDAGITAIYSTSWLRNRQTAMPLATLLGDSLRINSGKPDDVARAIRTHDRGGVVLVVGHSDTVPGIVEALSGKKVPPIGHGEHDAMYVVTLPNEGAASVVKLRYGAER